MKKNIYFILLTIFVHNFVLSQNKKQQLVKSDVPIQIVPNLDFNQKAIDSTIISSESFIKIKQAEVLINKDENTEALNIINTINEKDLEKNKLLLLKGILEIKSNDFINSSNSFSKYLNLVTNDSIRSSVYYILGVIDIKNNYLISAYSNFNKSYDLDNHNYYAAIALGSLNQNKNNSEKAILYYRKAVEINPNLNNIWNILAFNYQQMNKHSEAEKIFTKIIKDEPNSPFPYSNRSYSNLKLGNTEQAIKDINKSIKLLPNNSYAFRNRALIYLELKQIDKVCIDIETALRLGYKEKYGNDLDIIKSKNCNN